MFKTDRFLKFGGPSSIYFIAFVTFLLCIVHPIQAQGQGEPRDYSGLFFKAQASGSVRTIVKLDMPFTAESGLSTQEAIDQQARISTVQDRLLESLSNYGVKSVKRFRYIPYVAMEVDVAALSALVSNPLMVTIEEDVPVPPTLSESVPLINANDAWGLGYTGLGWTVAILDTGVDKTHSFLNGGKVVAEACFSTTFGGSSTTVCPNGQESQVGSGAGVNCDLSVDGCDHGTHVAGIAAGKADTINGVAKDANIIAVQVFSRFDSDVDCNGSPPCLRSFTADQILALEHVYSLRTTYNIASANMSLGGAVYPSYCDADSSAQKAAIDNLRSAGIATVIASGNAGSCSGISAPACISTAVSVGATTKADQEASYNNYGSILSLFAPGSSIYSSVPGGSFEFLSGTSMATPHVTGAWAVLKQKAPSASVSDILSALQSTGASIPNACSGSGYYAQRRIDVLAALNTLADPCDTTPDAFAFSDQTGVLPDTPVTSNAITVSSIVCEAPISITGGTYSINGGVYTSASGTVNDGDTVIVRQTSSSSNSATTHTTLTIGGVSDIFSVTTIHFLISPVGGTIGTEVVITRTGLGESGKAYLENGSGSYALKVSEWNLGGSGEVKAILKKALPPGIYDVVIAPKGGGPVRREGVFSVKAPEIDLISPNHGAAEEDVTVTGKFFGTKGKVTIGGKTCKTKTWGMNPATGDSEVVCAVPKGLPVGAQEFTVINKLDSATIGGGFTIDAP